MICCLIIWKKSSWSFSLTIDKRERERERGRDQTNLWYIFFGIDELPPVLPPPVPVPPLLLITFQLPGISYTTSSVESGPDCSLVNTLATTFQLPV